MTKWIKITDKGGFVVLPVPKRDRMLCAGGTLVVEVLRGVYEKPDKKKKIFVLVVNEVLVRVLADENENENENDDDEDDDANENDKSDARPKSRPISG